MLDELKRLNDPGRKEDLLYFLQVVVGKRFLKLADVRVLCSHAPAHYKLRTEPLIAYCAFFGWICYDENISICRDIYPILEDANLLNRYMVESTLKLLFENEILTTEMFTYDMDKRSISFRNELLPLSCASIRNVLISQSLLIVKRDMRKSTFWVHSDYENALGQFCKDSKRKLTLKQLKARLEANSIAGEKAESFALEYERRRISNHILRSQIKLISEIDVCAGYDLISFQSNQSTCYDRFIEVKAISHPYGFYWSKNEMEIAKLQGEKYYLYLVNLTKIGDEDYEPTIISNPALTIMNSQDWLIEPESYYIRKIII
jgi:hypothetical protein